MKHFLTICLLFSVFFSFAQIKNEKIISVTNQSCKVYDANYIQGKTYEWQGDVKNNLANGNGVLSVLISGTIYEKIQAEFIEGVAEGEGNITRPDEELEVIGVFKNGLINGPGKITKHHGYEYVGNLINDVAHGKGKIVYGNGSSFDGTFRSGVYWTGTYIDLKDNKQLYFRQRAVETLPAKKYYDPKLNSLITEYYDENWIRCDKSIASYYRKITYKAPNKPDGMIRDYYIDGTLQSEFKCRYIDYSDDYLNFHEEGVVKYYFENGQLSSVQNYNQQNSYYGESVNYYRNGNIKEEKTYNSTGYKDGVEYKYDEDGDLYQVSVFKNGSLYQGKFFEIDEKGYWSSVFKENFDENEESWSDNSKNVYSTVFDNKLSISINSKNGFLFNTRPFEIDKDRTYNIITSIYLSKKKQGFAFIFDYLDSDNFAMYYIDGKEFFIRRKINGEFHPVFSDKLSIDKGWNNVWIQHYMDDFLFYNNDELLHTCKAWKLTGDELGLYLSGKGFSMISTLATREFFTEDESVELWDYLEELELDEQNQSDKNTINEEINWDGNGSGFFLSDEGYIATNQHVIEGAKKIQVEYLENGEKKVFEAEVIVSDIPNDLAILEIIDEKFKMNNSIPYGLDFTIKDIGSDVFALGYPMADVLGDDIKYTEGTISSKTGINGDISTYQISVPIQPGNSGGPLFDENGNVVGITSSILNREMFDSENVNYAIKISYLKNLIDVLPKKIKVNNTENLKSKPKTEKIKVIRSFIPIIRVKL